MIENAQGQVALKRLRTNPKIIEVGKGKYYQFTPKFNICLAWVDPEDVDRILSMKRNCCNESGKKQFWVASEADVRRHIHGTR